MLGRTPSVSQPSCKTGDGSAYGDSIIVPAPLNFYANFFVLLLNHLMFTHWGVEPTEG